MDDWRSDGPAELVLSRLMPGTIANTRPLRFPAGHDGVHVGRPVGLRRCAPSRLPRPHRTWESVTARACGVDGVARGGYPAAQKAQWCRAAKSVSICGCGGTRDSICALPALPKAGQGTAAVAGLPVAAKVAQAVRMLAASAC